MTRVKLCLKGAAKNTPLMHNSQIFKSFSRALQSTRGAVSRLKVEAGTLLKQVLRAKS